MMQSHYYVLHKLHKNVGIHGGEIHLYKINRLKARFKMG